MREGLERLFATVPDVEVVGSAADGREAVALADQTVPDVVLMDIGMPQVDGVEATRRITAAHPASRVVMLTAPRRSGPDPGCAVSRRGWIPSQGQPSG